MTRSPAPVVQIHDLAGRLVARLAPSAADRRQRFSWSGRDLSGELVPPGSYLCRIVLGADSGDDRRPRNFLAQALWHVRSAMCSLRAARCGWVVATEAGQL